MKQLISNISLLVKYVNALHDKLLINSVKNEELRDSLIDINNIKETLSIVLKNIDKLECLDTNLYICFENNIYMSVIKNKYVISEIIDKDVKVLDTASSLKKALEIFYCYAYGEKRSKLKEILKLFKLS